MKSLLTLLLVALSAVTVQSFAVHTPVFGVPTPQQVSQSKSTIYYPYDDNEIDTKACNSPYHLAATSDSTWLLFIFKRASESLDLAQNEAVSLIYE